MSGRRGHDSNSQVSPQLILIFHMYSTFRIKPYLVQIHENVVLLFFLLFQPSDIFAKHHHTYSWTVVWKKSLPIQVKKICTAAACLRLYIHTS